MALYLAPIINGQQVDVDGKPLNGGFIKVYLADSSTPATTYNDEDGVNPNTWPIVLNTLGVNAQGAIWLTGGTAYKFVVENSAGVVQRSGSQLDNISGINDTTSPVDQWIVFQGTPTYVSSTSFSLVGDQTQTFQVGRRVRTTNTGGAVHSTIAASAYVAPNTVVTVVNDSGVLDSGLSAVAYGIFSVASTSAPYSPYSAWATASGNVTATVGTITTGTYALRYKIIGATVYFTANVTITTNGTGAGAVVISALPFTFIAEQSFAGRESQSVGFTVGCTGVTTTLSFSKYDGTYPGGNNYHWVVNGVAQIV